MMFSYIDCVRIPDKIYVALKYSPLMADGGSVNMKSFYNLCKRKPFLYEPKVIEKKKKKL